ncbi:autotransporter outer membrane beta-barrel domain-containing protein [Pyruvatibacter sp.]|uniref:autotransporter outer membrane beta-barrel domain-containing protein n=1 Tax=Pyruvatibacter sp. TaxID=1981328 RepID=UPI0032EB3902
MSGTATLTVPGVPVGTHTVTAANLVSLGYGITSITCTDSRATVDIATAAATIVLTGGETVICTFVAIEARAATSRMIADFLGARGTFLLANQPGSGRRTARFSSTKIGSTASGSLAGFGLSGSIPLPVQVAFSGDILSFSSAMGWGTQPGVKADDDTAPVFDLDRRTLWVEGTIAGFDDRQSDGSFGVVYAGADQLVTPDILVGALVQYDWFRQNADNGGEVTGTGWMAGPYATFRLDDVLFADVRAAWGRSSNDVSLNGQYTDSFDTTRWLASGALIGDFQDGAWSIRPTVSLAYLSETQESFTNTLNVAIPGQTVSQGEVSAGPQIGYVFELPSGDVLSPSVSFNGAYVFGDDGLFSDGSLAKEVSGLRGRTGAGLDYRMPGGTSLAISGNFDGIGTNASIYGGSLKLSIPLN